jgi:hypothetical protein
LSTPSETKLKKRENTRSFLEVEGMKECTFKPITNEGAPSGSESKIYKLPRVVRTDRDPAQMEFEKNKSELTFKPQINSKKSVQVK